MEIRMLRYNNPHFFKNFKEFKIESYGSHE